MDARNDAASDRTGLRSLISPWAMRHLRLCAGVRFAVGAFLLALAVIFCTAGDYGWAALPLVFAAVHFAWGYWQLSIARSLVPRT